MNDETNVKSDGISLDEMKEISRREMGDVRAENSQI